MRYEDALLIELKDERCCLAAQTGRWGTQHHPLLVGFERVGAAMHHPHVVLRINGHAGDRSKDPRLILERTRPPGIDLIVRAASLRACGVLEGEYAEEDEQPATEGSTRQ
jgi:hypothetical protein